MSNGKGTASAANNSIAICGVMIIVVSLFVALALVPDDYRPAGALFDSALALTLGLLAAPALRVMIGGYTDALRTEHFLLVALIYWILLDLLQTTYPLSLVEKEDVETAFVAIALFATGIWIGVMLPAWILPSIVTRASRQEFLPGQLYKAIWVCFLLSTFNYGYQAGFDPGTLIDNLLAKRWEAVWARGSLGDWTSFIEQLQYCGYLLPSLTVMLANRSKSNWLDHRVLLGILFSCVFIAFQMQGGSRRIVGVIIGAAILTWLLLSRRISLARVGVVLFLVWGVLNLLQGMLYVRTYGFESYLGGGIVRSEKRSYFAVDDNFLRLTQIVHLFPKSVEYVGSQQIVFALIRPVPRALWPEKPINPGFSLPALVGVTGASLSSSMLGELYASWGLIAVFIGGMFMGMLGKFWSAVDATGANNGSFLRALGMMVLFASIRSMQDLIILSYTIVAWVSISTIFARQSPKTAATST